MLEQAGGTHGSQAGVVDLPCRCRAAPEYEALDIKGLPKLKRYMQEAAAREQLLASDTVSSEDKESIHCQVSAGAVFCQRRG